MKSAVMLVVFALALTAPVSSWAQPQPPAVAQPSERALALSKRYIALMEMPKQMDALIASLIPQIMASMPDSKTLPPGAAQVVTDAAREATAAIQPKMLDRIAYEYAKVFSEDELQALVDFYGGPYGKSIVEKLPRALPAMTAAMSDLIPEMQKDMMSRVCAKLSCNANAPRKKAA
jgi:hypothetical protein